jgi:hypothetical protein
MQRQFRSVQHLRPVFSDKTAVRADIGMMQQSGEERSLLIEKSKRNDLAPSAERVHEEIHAQIKTARQSKHSMSP